MSLALPATSAASSALAHSRIAEVSSNATSPSWAWSCGAASTTWACQTTLGGALLG